MSTRNLYIFPLLLLLLLFGACSKIEDGSIKPPLVYRIDIQQGNVIDQSMVNKLRPGMEKKQVRFIMGTPMLIDPFHDDRWDYVFTYQEGGRRREKRHITLYFEDDKLAYIRGDIKVTHVPVQTEETNTEKSIVVPDNYNNDTLLERWLSDKPEPLPVPEPDDVKAPEADETRDQETETAAMDNAGPETAATDQAPEDATTEESGFFSNLWDKLSGGDDDAPPPDAEVLQPELENK